MIEPPETTRKRDTLQKSKSVVPPIFFPEVKEDRTTTNVRIAFAAAARRHIYNPCIRFDEGLYARNVSFVISSRWIFHSYQLV